MEYKFYIAGPKDDRARQIYPTTELENMMPHKKNERNLFALMDEFVGTICDVATADIIESKSVYGKLNGNGNGIQYFGVVLVAKDSIKDVDSLISILDDKFEIEDFRKDGNCEYRYAFTLKRRGGGGISLKDSREVRRALRLMIRDDYKLSYPDVPIASLIVDFPEFSQRGGIIKGRAAVLSLNVKSLRYDPHARKGKIHIRIGENQLEDARLYARENIASLVRDKNIALDAREIPPAATFYLSGEAVKDDILEITFKTE
jgi:hypothetical protein